ncbi:MAG TPA: hypothetical protein VMF86_15755 [Stellaceae bacterium]|nr:hypothetical protein [Stellaceae bacterium]
MQVSGVSARIANAALPPSGAVCSILPLLSGLHSTHRILDRLSDRSFAELDHRVISAM